ncbi:MAG: hypothetical protein PHR36_00765 [Patescibacteria group bacterium]|nr:hypothetical protein [Patescibacteria group bacterium]
MIFKKKAALFIFFTLFAFFLAGEARAGQVNPPTIIELGDKKGKEFSPQFFVKGLTPANTEVLVYIDGTYTDFAKVKREGTESDSFYYEHPTALAGGSEIKLIGRDKTSLVLSPPVEVKYIILPLPAPTLVSPAPEKIVGEPKPYITGLVKSGSLAHIYIDGVYNGKTKIVSHESGTANFAYQPFLNLEIGPHKVWAVAENEQGRKSGISNVLEFLVQKPMPAPTLFSPVVNNETKYNQPFIIGLSKNDSSVKIFIDNKPAGQFAIFNHPSGTANFALRPEVLARGNHSVYATAVDSRGKESQRSNIIYFSVRQPVISGGVQEERGGLVGKIEEPAKEIESGSPLIVSPSGNIEKEDDNNKNKEISRLGEIEGITGEENKAEKDASGAVNESREKQGKLGVNLAVFIVFILAVIGWIFWVNKELGKEQRENSVRKSGRDGNHAGIIIKSRLEAGQPLADNSNTEPRDVISNPVRNKFLSGANGVNKENQENPILPGGKDNSSDKSGESRLF